MPEAKIVDFRAWRHFVSDSLYNLVTGLGTTADKSTQTLYSFNELPKDQIDAAYRSDWVARKIIDVPSEDATREWREWQAETDQVTLLEKEERRLDVQRKLRRTLIRARTYGGAVILIGVRKDDWAAPLQPETVRKGELTSVIVLNRHEVSPQDFVRDKLDPRFGQPNYYVVSTGGPRGSQMVHWSRVVKLLGAEVPDSSARSDGWSDSSLQPVDNAVKAAGLCQQGIAGLVWESKVDVIKIPDLMQNLSTKEYKDRLIERFTLANQAKSFLGALILDKEEEWDHLQVSFGSLPDIMDRYMQIASGAAEIPISRMYGVLHRGMSAGGQNSDATRDYYDRVSSEQKNELQPTLAPLDEVLIRSALGDRPEEVHYNWRSLYLPTAAEKADVALKKGQTYQIDVNAGLVLEDALAQGRINQLIEDGTYPGFEQAIEDAKVAAAKEITETDPEARAQLEASRGREPTDPHETAMQQVQLENEKSGQKRLPPPRDAAWLQDWNPDQPRDADGKWTMTVYHGTGAESPHSSWLTTHEGLARDYARTSAEAFGGTPHIFTGTMRFGRPHVVSSDVAEWLPYEKDRVEKLRSEGYDVIMNENGHEIFVLHPEMVTWRTRDAAWDPDKHPRDKSGRWTGGATGERAEHNARHMETLTPEQQAFHENVANLVVPEGFEEVGTAIPPDPEQRQHFVHKMYRRGREIVRAFPRHDLGEYLVSHQSETGEVHLSPHARFVRWWRKQNDASWNPEQHPRVPGGQAHGGEFVGGGGALDISKLKKVGGQLGSNPGGVYAHEGQKFYVKKGRTKAHVTNELIAADLAREAGMGTLQYRDVAGGGHVATRWEQLDKDNARKFSEGELAQARADFAAHAWLSNWDAAGLGFDNLGTVGGRVTSLDLGGALEYRAQGEPKGKAFGDEVGELRTLRDPSINPQNAKIFGRITPEELRRSAERVTRVPDSRIREVVAARGGSAALAERLIARKRSVRRQVLGTSDADPIFELEDAGWDKSKHPREPAGSSAGGEFTSGGSGADKPDWWDQPSDNVFARGMTQGEVITEWLNNHKVPRDSDGKYVFYHATPKANKLTFLRAGSQLETDPKDAAFFAGRDRGLRPRDVTVHRVTVYAHEIHTGVWASLRNDYSLGTRDDARGGDPYQEVGDYNPSQKRKPKGDPHGGEWEGDDEDELSSTGVRGKLPKLSGHSDQKLLRKYTHLGSYFYNVNAGLRIGHLMPHEEKQIAGIRRALEKLPEHRGLVYRGVERDLSDKYRAARGKIVTERAFLSTSKNRETAETFAGDMMYEIDSKRGRDLSGVTSHKNEQEVLFAAGSRFRVVKVGRSDKPWPMKVVRLREV